MMLYFDCLQDKIHINKLNSLKYLDAVICETLRMFPPHSFAERITSQDYMIDSYKLKVPKGTAIHIPIHSIHRDPDYFSEPDQFKPERFFHENRNFHSYAFIPFGAGPRKCIGTKWALIISKFALFYTIYNFKFSATQSNLVNKLFFQSFIYLYFYFRICQHLIMKLQFYLQKSNG